MQGRRPAGSVGQRTRDDDLAESFGLFVLRDFLDPHTCAAIRAEVRSAPGFPARVYVEGSPEPIHENVRKTTTCRPAEETIAFVEQRLSEQQAALAAYFDLPLTGCERPQFLLYREADFFVRHQDCDRDQQDYDHLRTRKVSIVIFLNDGVATENGDTFGGGYLAFHRGHDDPANAPSSYSLVGETGLLVAFKATTIHEVTPVTQGERFTVVSWFN